MAAIMSIRGELWKGSNVSILLEVGETGGQHTFEKMEVKWCDLDRRHRCVFRTLMYVRQERGWGEN
eukprot:scaffold19814_cov71-Skeletonema_dohrnii-CCMP3373.AAC.3